MKETRQKKADKGTSPKRIVPDTSVLINGTLSEKIAEGRIKNTTIIFPAAVIDELQAQASRGRETGFEGLGEIKRIRGLAAKAGVKLEFTGQRPTLEEIQLAKKGRIDAIIRDVAARQNAILLTSDYVQALVGEAEGVSVEHIAKAEEDAAITLEKFFTKETQSVHLKAGVRPYAKRGKPGQIELRVIREKPIEEKELKSIIDQVISKARKDDDSFIEIGKHGALVIQMGLYRISITRPPFSEGVELTAVRPITRCRLSDYNLHKELESRILRGSQGILISGPPGSGKSTFAASVADFLSENGKVVKTFEQPRDLQVGPEITQYAPLEGDWEKTSEVLLLVRPDYTIFDEIRKSKDFRIFSDMRLAGVGMLGVVHAASPVSSIQRFIGRLELGTIPHVLDTVIYIKAGKIERVFELKLTVKVPTGMKEADLARPVVEITDFESQKLAYEIYTYGEENVIMSIEDSEKPVTSPVRELAKQRIYQALHKYDHGMGIEFLSDDRINVKVDNDVIARIIGKKGQNIDKLEKELGIRISVEPREATTRRPVPHGFDESGGHFTISVDLSLTGKEVDVYSRDEFLFSAIVGRRGTINVRKKSPAGKKALQAHYSGRLRVYADV
jgi:ATPase